VDDVWEVLTSAQLSTDGLGRAQDGLNLDCTTQVVDVLNEEGINSKQSRVINSKQRI